MAQSVVMTILRYEREEWPQDPWWVASVVAIFPNLTSPAATCSTSASDLTTPSATPASESDTRLLVEESSVLLVASSG